MLKFTFQRNQTTFFKELKEKIDHYFAETKKDPAGNGRLYLKGAIQMLSAAVLYTVLVFFTPATWIAIPLSILFGLNLGLIGFNVMHEGGHQSFSRHPWINKASAYSLNMLGGITYFWKIKHNVNHHTFTNIDGMDSDIDAKPFMRMHAEQPRYWFHRFQHIYWVFLYGISYIAWVFYEDFEKYFTGRHAANSAPKKLDLKEHVIFWITKIMYVVVYIVVPVIMVGWLPALIGFFIVTFVTGLSISVVFQLAHVVEGTQFHSPHDQEDADKQEWAIHQLRSTANFATGSKVLHWLLGGLNFQIEHHLFPRISHVHYPQVSRMVKEVCDRYNVTYIEYKTMFHALGSHLVHLKRLGRAD
ncbi:MAG TPA: acyl-CoA desaturase [Chryseosolibacter sp.]|nr:acyl-CoA desaturase [Chryseosolibacter sp.]